MCAVAGLTLGIPWGGWAEGSSPCSLTTLEPLTTTKVEERVSMHRSTKGRGRGRGGGRGLNTRRWTYRLKFSVP